MENENLANINAEKISSNQGRQPAVEYHVSIRFVKKVHCPDHSGAGGHLLHQWAPWPPVQKAGPELGLHGAACGGHIPESRNRTSH